MSPSSPSSPQSGAPSFGQKLARKASNLALRAVLSDSNLTPLDPGDPIKWSPKALEERNAEQRRDVQQYEGRLESAARIGLLLHLEVMLSLNERISQTMSAPLPTFPVLPSGSLPHRPLLSARIPTHLRLQMLLVVL
ncbi:hypothetical protein IAR55_002073 [Kwoniella newhampshirensis]|uniref:Uncharacterized protein n=1 Tax=Kwoniella newhampshirensis TaxID=1651941 RepID=A0AAW0YSU3_9TREE